MFLDSDDFLHQNALLYTYEKCITTNSDICVFRSYQYDDKTRAIEPITYSIKTNLIPNDSIFTANDIKQNVFGIFIGWAWDKLYRRKFIYEAGLEFQNIPVSNDMYFVFSSIIDAKRITVLNDHLVYHRVNNMNSISNKRERTFNCFLVALEMLRNRLVNRGQWIRFERDFINYVVHACLWNFDTLRGQAVLNLVKEVYNVYYDKFCLKDKEEDYFWNKDEYVRFRDIFKAD